MRRTAVALVAAALALNGTAADNAYTPRAKASPALEIEISGMADLEIAMWVKAITRNRKCYETTNWAMGATSPRVVSVPLKVENKSGRYRAVGRIDIYEPGECEWTPFSIDYEVKKGNVSQLSPVPPTSLIWFVPNGRATLPLFDVACEDVTIGTRKYMCSQPRGNYRLSLQTHQLQVNFFERKWRGQPDAVLEKP